MPRAGSSADLALYCVFYLDTKFTITRGRQDSLWSGLLHFLPLFFPLPSARQPVTLHVFSVSGEICGRDRNGDGSRHTLLWDFLFFPKPGSIKAIMLGILDREGERESALEMQWGRERRCLECGKVAEPGCGCTSAEPSPCPSAIWERKTWQKKKG